MSQPAERTPLLATSPPASPPSKWYTVPYGLILCLFLLCNTVAFIPKDFLPKGSLPEDFATLQICALLVADFIIDISWPPLGHVVEYAASVAIGRQSKNSERRMIRKSESLNAFLKACLKILPIFSTIVLVAEQLSFLFIPLVLVYLVITAGFTFVLVASARMVQSQKVERDDTLENNTQETDETKERRNWYTAAMKTNDKLRNRWKVILLIGVVVLLFFGWRAGNMSICIRLGHQIRSLDETCHKLAQSFPKASRILEAIRETGGILSNLVAACASVWGIAPRPLMEIPELQAPGRFCLAVRRAPGRLIALLGGMRICLIPSAMVAMVHGSWSRWTVKKDKGESSRDEAEWV